jgi:hypothetical protein
MAKHDRKQMRKLRVRETASAVRAKIKGRSKSATPETLQNRFNHIMQNQSDIDAICNYGSTFDKAFGKATGSTAAQLKRMLGEQLTQLKQLAFPNIECATTTYFKSLFYKLHKIAK